MALATDLVTDADGLAALATEWRDLLARSDDDQPTLSPTWLLEWWRVFGSQGGRRLRVVTLREGGRLVGLVPMCRRTHWYRRALPFRRLELLASGEAEEDEISSDYVGPIVERGADEAVADAITDLLSRRALGRWDEIVMPAMNGERAIGALLAEKLARAGFRASCVETGASPYIALPAKWELYLAALPSSRRYLVTRSLRDWEKWTGAPPELVRAESPAELVEGLRILRSLHGERWNAKGGGGAFGSPLFSAFHEAVMPRLLAERALDLSWVSARGEPVAVLYSIVWNGRVHFYQSGRSVGLPKNIRPGIVAHACTIRRAISSGLREYDFLAGDSQYKMQLALATRPLVLLRAVNTVVRERARAMLERAAATIRDHRSREARAAGSAPEKADKAEKDRAGEASDA